jgi:hypothetical protein
MPRVLNKKKPFPFKEDEVVVAWQSFATATNQVRTGEKRRASDPIVRGAPPLVRLESVLKNEWPNIFDRSKPRARTRDRRQEDHDRATESDSPSIDRSRASSTRGRTVALRLEVPGRGAEGPAASELRSSMAKCSTSSIPLFANPTWFEWPIRFELRPQKTVEAALAASKTHVNSVNSASKK